MKKEIAERSAVRCIAWLGLSVIPRWGFCVVWALCLFSMYQCVRILVEEHRERKERNRECQDQRLRK